MARIERIQIGIEFDIDEEIVLTAGTEATKIQKKFGGKTATYNVPSAAPPSAPRLMVQSKSFLLNIGLSRYDLMISVPSHIAPVPEKALGFAHSLMIQLEPYLSHLPGGYKWSGIIAVILHPASEKMSAIKAVEPVFDRLINIDRKERDLAALQIQYGFIEEGCNVLYTISGYESRNINISGTNLQVQKYLEIDMSKGDLLESGIQVNVDVNNKPYRDHLGFLSDFAILITKASDAAKNLSSRLNLEEII